MNQLTVVGVGLIGGSVGLAARSRGAARRVVGVGRDVPTLERALSAGAIDEFTLDLEAGVARADLVVVCTPVDRVAEDALRACRAAPARCVVTDAGSTKAEITRAVAAQWTPGGAAFVGSHPLAGSEKSGAANGRADLFERRVVVVTPTVMTDPGACAVVEGFWRSLGAVVVRLDPDAHDVAVAATSHLPHAAASAVAAVTPREYLALAAGGFRDTTRIAAGDPDLWAAIFCANRKPLLKSLDDFLASVGQLRDALERDDGERIRSWLAEGKQVRDALGS